MNKIKKCSITQKDRIVIHKEDIEKRIYKNELEYYLQNGWYKGISDKHRSTHSKAHKGNIPWNKDLHGVMHSNSTTWTKGNIPWNKGKKGVQVPWTKGLTKETDNRVKKSSQTMKDNYSLSHRMKNAETCRKRKGIKLSKDVLEIKLTKEYITKKRNNSFNKSKPEQDFYTNLLKENINKTIYRQYKDNDRYPFYCDFYIKEDDLFIELNFHWTHGGRPYDPNDKECQEQLLDWQNKAKTSQFYKNAIYTWTVRDVLKAKVAKDNNLNYKVIY